MPHFAKLCVLLFLHCNIINAQDDSEGRGTTPQFVTYENFGVFPLRPGLKKLPESPSKVNTQFLLYRKVDRSAPGESITVNNLGSLNPSKPIKVIIHGFTDTAKNKWVINMKEELLKTGDMNVITVDWSGGNQFPYDQAVANIVIPATEVRLLLNKAIERGVSPQQIHLIGHSLGAHIAGYVGKQLKNIARITGLDPAGPEFYNPDPNNRLSPQDASFVDVIHTDGASNVYSGFGHLDSLGTVDFYPNAGYAQPSCGKHTMDTLYQTIGSFASSLSTETALDTLACNHMAAIFYYIDSINGNSPSYAYPCANYSQFQAGQCLSCGVNQQNCQQMGYYASPTKQKGSLYLMTLHGFKAPFFGTHWTVTAISGQDNDQQTKGTFTLSFGNLGAIQIINQDTKMTPGLQSVKTIVTANNVVPSQEVTVAFQKNYGISFGFGLADQWSLSSVTMFNLQTKQQYKFCSTLKVKTGGNLTFQRCN